MTNFAASDKSPTTERGPLIAIRVPQEWYDLIQRQPAGKRAEFVRVMMHTGMERALGKKTPKLGTIPRYTRYYPVFHKWDGKITFRIYDPKITKQEFERLFIEAGTTTGVGRGRPSTGCPNGLGRFRPIKFEWETIA